MGLVLLVTMTGIGEKSASSTRFMKAVKSRLQLDIKQIRTHALPPSTTKECTDNIYSFDICPDKYACMISDKKLILMNAHSHDIIGKALDCQTEYLGLVAYMDKVVAFRRNNLEVCDVYDLDTLKNKKEVAGVSVKAKVNSGWFNFSELYCITPRGKLYAINSKNELYSYKIDSIIAGTPTNATQIARDVINLTSGNRESHIYYMKSNGDLHSLSRYLLKITHRSKPTKQSTTSHAKYGPLAASSHHIVSSTATSNQAVTYQLWSTTGKLMSTLTDRFDSDSKGNQIKSIKIVQHMRLPVVVSLCYWTYISFMAIHRGKLHMMLDKARVGCLDNTEGTTNNGMTIVQNISKTETSIIVCGYPKVLAKFKL